MKRETDSLQQKKTLTVELQRQVESLEKEVLTKTKNAQEQSQELETQKKSAEAERKTLCDNYRKILEEQEFAMDAQVSWRLAFCLYDYPDYSPLKVNDNGKR